MPLSVPEAAVYALLGRRATDRTIVVKHAGADVGMICPERLTDGQPRQMGPDPLDWVESLDGHEVYFRSGNPHAPCRREIDGVIIEGRRRDAVVDKEG